MEKTSRNKNIKQVQAADKKVQATEEKAAPKGPGYFIGMIMSEKGPWELMAVQDADAAKTLLSTYKETGTLQVTQDRVTNTYRAIAMGVFALVDGYKFEEPQLAAAVPSESEGE